MTDILWHAENEYVSAAIYADASADLLDRVAGVRWHMGRVALQEDGPIDVGHVWLRQQRSICEEYAGRFRGEVEGDALRFTLLGREGREVGRFACRLRLDGPWLEIRIEDVDEAIPSLIFPTPIESESLVLPMNAGRWIRQPLPDRSFWVYPSHLNMRWFGGLRGDDGWIAIFHEGEANAGILAAELSAAPGWLKSLGRWSGPCTIRYRFTQGGYVGLAKTYRAYAIEYGLHRTLAEKMEAVPAVRNLLGGRLISFMQAEARHAQRYEDRLLRVPPDLPPQGLTPDVMCSYAQAREIVDDALRMGMRRGLVALRGWICGGYDETHPDIWPPDPALGSMDELHDLLACRDPLLTVLHDNYQDIYRQSASWPRGVNITAAGHPMPGGLWAGGQAYILNSRDSVAYARRNWEQIKALIPQGIFVDTTTAVQWYESYEPGNELTRAQDGAYKVELLRFFKEQGLALGSEEGADFGAPWVDWIENRHLRIPGVSIPLWQLVFHDAAFTVRYARPYEPESKASPAPRWLADMLWGCPLYWEVREAEHWLAVRAAFACTLHVDDWHAQVGAAEMLSHRYLTEDGEVEETVFAPGTAMVVNFAPEPRTVEGLTVPAYTACVRP